MSGGFAHNHLNIGVVRQAAMALKKGGMFINSMRELFITSVPELHGLEPLYLQMEMEKIVKWLIRLVDENVSGNVPGLYHVLRKI